MQLMDLAVGALFTWRQNGEVHKVISQPRYSSGKTTARCVAWKNGEEWVPATRDSDENWNPLADVREVRMRIEVR